MRAVEIIIMFTVCGLFLMVGWIIGFKEGQIEALKGNQKYKMIMQNQVVFKPKM